MLAFRAKMSAPAITFDLFDHSPAALALVSLVIIHFQEILEVTFFPFAVEVILK